MSVPRGAVHAKWIVGKVIGTKMQKTAKVRVTRLVLDPYLLKELGNDLVVGVTAKDEKQFVVRIPPYELSAKCVSLECFVNALHLLLVEKFFNKRKTYFAHDPLQQCVVGDIVLLKALPERRSKHVKHELAEIVFKVGKVIDPITGKPCAGTRFLENLSDSENLTEADTTYLSEKLQELKVCSTNSGEKV